MGQALIALDRPVLVMYINIGLAVLGIGLNLLLIPHVGLAGAGWSAAAAAWFSYRLQRAAVAKEGLPLTRPRAIWIQIFFALAYGLAWAMNATVWSFFAAAVYAMACIAVGAVSAHDLRALFRKEPSP
jgi:O-antigen/teichoic acid export membrane protein